MLARRNGAGTFCRDLVGYLTASTPDVSGGSIRRVGQAGNAIRISVDQRLLALVPFVE